MSQASSRASSCRSRSSQYARTQVSGSSAPPKRRRDFLAERATPLTLPSARVNSVTNRSASRSGYVRKTIASDCLRAMNYRLITREQPGRMSRDVVYETAVRRLLSTGQTTAAVSHHSTDWGWVVQREEPTCDCTWEGEDSRTARLA